MVSLSRGLLIGKKLRLDREIARGGMGSVWVAFNTQLETPVAVKFMAPAAVGSPELVSRFQREAKAAAQLRSPHVVQVFEHGMHIGLPYIVMELLEGEDLGKRLARRGRLPLNETADVVNQVSKALRRAHELGIVHRDLKPANVFIARHDDDEVVKVLDFGIAKSLTPGSGDESTQTGTLVGTPNYMSPEQAQRSKQIDARSDLWSLGVIAFRALTGTVPFKGDDMINVLVKVCSEPIPAPSSIAPDLGPEIDAFFERALCRDPAGRFQTAREMSDAFGALLGRMSMPSEMSLAAYVPASTRFSAVVPPPPPSRSGGTPAVVVTPPAARSGPHAALSSSPALPAAVAPVAAADEPETVPVRPELLSGGLGIAGGASPAQALASAAVAGAAPAQGAPQAPGAPAALGQSGSFGSITAANTETPLHPFAPPSRARVGLVLGGAVALLVAVVAAASVLGGGDDPAKAGPGGSSTAGAVAAPLPSSAPSSSAALATASAPEASAQVAQGAPSGAATGAPSAVPAATSTSAGSAGVSSAAAPGASGSSAPLKGTLPGKSGAGPRSTGAIGGAPKF